MPTYRYRCSEGHVHEDFRSMARQHEATSCPVCEAPCENTYIPWEGGFNSFTLGLYGVHGGYYDHGLGCAITSEAQREARMKQLGVEPVGGTDRDQRDWFNAGIAAQRRRDEADAATVETYQTELAESPEYRPWREANDKGAFDDILHPPAPTETIDMTVNLAGPTTVGV